MSQQYDLILNAYRQSLAVFEREKPPVSWNEVLKILVLRDRLQFLLSKSSTITAEQLTELAGQDQILKRYQDKIAIQSELDEWRQRLHPPQSSWWWWMKFEKNQRWWNRYDWLFSAGTLIMLTIWFCCKKLTECHCPFNLSSSKLQFQRFH